MRYSAVEPSLVVAVRHGSEVREAVGGRRPGHSTAQRGFTGSGPLLYVMQFKLKSNPETQFALQSSPSIHLWGILTPLLSLSLALPGVVLPQQ